MSNPLYDCAVCGDGVAEPNWLKDMRILHFMGGDIFVPFETAGWWCMACVEEQGSINPDRCGKSIGMFAFGGAGELAMRLSTQAGG